MKNFLISFLGTLAGIWLSVLIAVVGGAVVVAMLVASSLGANAPSVPKHSVLYLPLEGVVAERPAMPSVSDVLQGSLDAPLALDQVVAAIDHAATDDRIDGLFIECRGASAGVAARQAMFNAVRRFRRAAPGKWVWAYGDAYTQGDYLVASAADSVFINPVGTLELKGLSATTLYFKDLLEKIGVDVQVVKVGTYKSAVEPFTLAGASDASKEQQRLYLGNIWSSLADSIASARRLKPGLVRQLADRFIFTDSTQAYLSDGLVDGLLYRHQMDDKIKKATGKDDPVLVTPAQYCEAANVARTGRGRDSKIAILYADGDITENGDGGIASERLAPQILDLAEKEDIDGLVLRVNSPGGSAFASEQIWEALCQYKKISGKPLYVSMGDYAASGGYYISCCADRIFALPGTLTGSIGIYGMVPDASRLLNDKLGVHTTTVSTGDMGDFPSLLNPMSPAQAAAMQRYVERGYDLFTRRVAAGRHTTQDSVKLVAEGRVWDGTQARRLGLVDDLGDLHATVRALARQLGADSWTVETYPALKYEWWQPLIGGLNDARQSMARAMAGQSAAIYEAVERLRHLAPLQCRMDYVTIN